MVQDTEAKIYGFESLKTILTSFIRILFLYLEKIFRKSLMNLLIKAYRRRCSQYSSMITI